MTGLLSISRENEYCHKDFRIIVIQEAIVTRVLIVVFIIVIKITWSQVLFQLIIQMQNQHMRILIRLQVPHISPQREPIKISTRPPRNVLCALLRTVSFLNLVIAPEHRISSSSLYHSSVVTREFMLCRLFMLSAEVLPQAMSATGPSFKLGLSMLQNMIMSSLRKSSMYHNQSICLQIYLLLHSPNLTSIASGYDKIT